MRFLPSPSQKCSQFHAVFTVRNVVAARLCFHRRLSFCSGGVYPSMHWADPPDRHPFPLGRHPPGYTAPLFSACWDTHTTPPPIPPPTPVATGRFAFYCILVFFKLANRMLATPLPGGLAPPPTGNPGSAPDFCFVKEWGQYIMLLYNLSVSANPPSKSLPNIQNTCYAALQLKCSIGQQVGKWISGCLNQALHWLRGQFE